MKSRDGQRQGDEKSRREQIREEKESEERRCRCAKRIGVTITQVTCAPGFVDTNLTLEHKTTKVESVRGKNPTEEYPG